ncbi:VOC family protein [Pseudoprimorskyibacter insulae]|uniref:VOC domain-containing protein n=1 Tax=Pseudoprimorskyibacter insulae TaxID=1695997 RepID=A0A2R8AVU8_9RHOB|nr:VOC family protein [Pseudoprimorskyibacter insulae]SPF80162.1 hypothetical protein PRI8871_01968 [Pseudoprimorskyibacter insulae]
MTAQLEHVNITVTDPDLTAAFLCDLLGWRVRWSGAALDNGYTVHVGGDAGYLALYRQSKPAQDQAPRYTHRAALNHVGIVVEDLDAIEAKVAAAGFKPKSHADYEPGRRFYFMGPDGVEYEMISYR